MKKIIVIGSSGSGKTTFSEKLAKKTGLPLIYLDSIWHRADKTHISREEFDLKLSEILSRDSYIIDGNYQRTLKRRFLSSDTVFFLDLGTEECLSGAISRLGKARPDMPWIDMELDPGLERKILEYKEKCRPEIYKLIEEYGDKKTVIIFKTKEETDLFLESL